MVALCLALMTVAISSYIRLLDSGLGCEPWPVCYGQYNKNESAQGINVLKEESEQSAYRAERALHRIIASTLGIVILILFVLSWKEKFRVKIGRRIPAALMLFTIMLALIGPIHPQSPVPILTLMNFVGGLIIVAFIFYLYRQISVSKKMLNNLKSLRPVRLGIFIIILQIFWGGWTSANYAGTSCERLMNCQYTDHDNATLIDAINPMSVLTVDNTLKVIIEDKMAIIQLIHHVLAVFSLIYFAIIVALLLRTKNPSEKPIRNDCIVVMVLLLLQFILGLATVKYALPITLVVTHNILAAFLIMAITSLYIKLQTRVSQ